LDIRYIFATMLQTFTSHLDEFYSHRWLFTQKLCASVCDCWRHL